MDVLMIRLGGLGDLLVASPSMAYLRGAMPGRRFTLLCRGDYGGLMADTGIADRIVPAEGREATVFFGAAGVVGPSDPPSGFELAAAWMQKPPPAEMMETLGSHGIPVAVFQAPCPPHSVPISQAFFDAARSRFTGPEGKAAVFEDCARLRSEKGGMAAGRARLRVDLPDKGRFAVIHPGSGGASKLWPLGRFLEIARRLGNAGVPGIFVTGEAEECPSIAGRLEREVFPGGWYWLRRPPLLGLAGLLAEGPLYLGNDSGVTHLAAACGARVTALFPEDNLPAWKPFGETLVVAARVPADIDPDVVWTALAENAAIPHNI